MPFFPQSKEYLLSTIIFLYQEYFYESISRHQSHIQRPTKRERSTSLPKKSNSSSISFHLNSNHFPSDYFHESISRPILSLFHPCFLSRNKVYTQTYTRFNRSNGTRSLDLHKAWAYPFPAVSWKDSVLRRDAPGRGEQCGWECVYRCTCPSRFDVTLMCNFRPRAPPTTVFALTYKRARSQRVLGLPQ